MNVAAIIFSLSLQLNLLSSSSWAQVSPLSYRLLGSSPQTMPISDFRWSRVHRMDASTLILQAEGVARIGDASERKAWQARSGDQISLFFYCLSSTIHVPWLLCCRCRRSLFYLHFSFGIYLVYSHLVARLGVVARARCIYAMPLS
jgi:hypothetical protein